MKYLLLLACFLFTACESSQDMFKAQSANSNQTITDNSDDSEVATLGIRCEMMSRTGSNRKTKVCRTAEQAKKDADTAERTLGRLQKNGGTIGN
jgi:uncharacterized protein YcfL